MMEDLSLDLSPTENKLVHLSKVNGALQPGDHIAVPILPSPEVDRPWHHGIYIGEEGGECWVIHRNGHDKASATIRRDSLEVFCGQASHIAIVQYATDGHGHGGDRGRDNVVKVASYALNTSHGEVYNIINNNNNCEHFATWCRTGRCVLDPHIDHALNLLYEKVLLSHTPNKCSI
jgi:hypothetical protein